jgi:hypothetical protein
LLYRSARIYVPRFRYWTTKIVKVMFALGQAMKAQRGVELYLYAFFNLGATWGWVVNATLRQLYPREREPVPIV